MKDTLSKTEFAAIQERYFLMSKQIKECTSGSIIKESTDQQQERIKHLLKPENYIDFFDYYFGVDSGLPLADARSAWFHNDSYQKVYKNRKIRQLREWYRGAAKSIHTNVGNILHLKENDELYFGILIGRNEGLAKILLSDLQAHMESNERLIKDFGQQVSYGSWADGEFSTKDGRFFKALGLNQPFRGLRFGQYRPDFASVDDCEDRDRVNNQKQITKYGEKITGDLKKAFHKERGRLIVPNNYIVEGGILDFLKEKWKDSKNLDVSRVDLATKNITRENCRTDLDWEPNWPERYTRADIIEIIEDDDFYTSQREDFNTPIEEGKLFKAHEVIYTSIADNEVFDGILDHWDLSYVTDGDYKAGVLLGIKGMKLFVLEVFCQRCEINAAMEVRAQWYRKYLRKGYNLMGFFDATAAQRVVYTPVILQAAKDNKCPNIPIGLHQEGDKHNRIATGIRNILFRKLLFWDQSLKIRSKEHFDIFMKLFLAFEKGTTANDDAPDTLERAITLAQTYFGYDDSDSTGSNSPTFGRKKDRRV